jgi:2-phosphosulfolactate phosphatase
MLLDYVSLPYELADRDLSKSVAVVLDVLRATTSMAAALDAGAREIRTLPTLDAARAAHAAFDGGPKLLAGELKTRKPDGFDLGNRPPEFDAVTVAGKTIFMATTNGTRAIRACVGAGRTIVASLANASAAARVLAADGRDVVFVCSGVDGEFAPEDADGAATIADAVVRLRPDAELTESMRIAIAVSSWLSHPFDGVARLRDTPSGRNLINAQLDGDIPYIAKVDRFDVVGEVRHVDDGSAVVMRV